MINSNEQWKLDGDCTKCRRANYCGSSCTASKKKMRALIQKAYDETLKSQYPELNQITNEVK